MVVYSYYYGAAANQGIGIKAESAELKDLKLHSTLTELSSMQALKASDNASDMLSYKCCKTFN